jgi:hypothetical protein
MPLVGTICCQTGQPTSFEICEENCRQGVCQHPLPMIVNMRKNSEKREGIGVSASTLGGCPRQYLLGRDKDYYEDPEDYYARWFGSFAHYAIEMEGPYPGVIQEVRFYRHITTNFGRTEVEISGQPDWIDTTTQQSWIVADHKMTGRKPTEPMQEHIQQLNVYRWLIEGGWGATKNPEKFGLDSHVILDGKVGRLELRYYHPGKVRHTEFQVPIWSDELVEDYIRRALVPLLHNNPNDVGVYGKNNEWRYNYCPWRHPCNNGTCCMAPISIP